MLQALALTLIRGYQRHISPRKGFSCAYRVICGGHSCSTHGYHAISKHGVFLGLRLIRRRLDRCAWAHHTSRQSTGNQSIESLVAARAAAQAGFIDGCDAGGCDVGGCDGPDCSGCDVGSCDLTLPCDHFHFISACDAASIANFDCDGCFPFGSSSSQTGGSSGVARESERRVNRATRRATSPTEGTAEQEDGVAAKGRVALSKNPEDTEAADSGV